MISAAWSVIAWVGSRWGSASRTFGRVLLTAAAGFPALALLYLLAPGFIESPLSAVDDLYEQVRLSKLRELQPLFTEASEGFSWAGHVARPSLWFGLALLAWPVLLWRLWRERGAVFWLWAAVGLNAAIFTVMALMQIRWLPYAVTSLILPYAFLLHQLLDRLPQLNVKPLLARLFVAVYVIWWVAPTILVASFGPAAKALPVALTSAFNGSCDYAALGRHLSDLEGLGANPLKVLIFTDHGSELLYRTPHSVLSMPNHRLQPGFSESYEIFAALDHAGAVERIRANEIDLVVVCADDANARGFYRTAGGDGAEEPKTLFYRLQTGSAPTGLLELPLPMELSPLRLYKPAP